MQKKYLLKKNITNKSFFIKLILILLFN